MFGKSSTWVNQYNSLNDLPTEVQELLEPTTPEEKRVSLQIALLLLGAPREQQVELAMLVSEMSLSYAQAKHLIDGRLSSSGHKRTNYSPRSEFTSLKKQFSNWDSHIGLLLDKKESDFDGIFRGGKPQEVEELIEQINRLRDNLEQVSQVTSRVLTKMKANGGK